MKTQITRGLLLVTILFGVLLPGAPTGTAQANGVSPEKFLNADGTLNLDGAFSGALDLQGYNVALDPVRGPVFGPTGRENNLSAATAPPGNWAGVGDGGGNIDGYVREIAVSGADVYVAGDFTDAANIPEADYIARWDGTNWSALGSNGSGDGALNNSVYALAVNGADVYVGGGFNNVNTNGIVLSAADYLAKWDGANWSAVGSNGAGDGSLNSTVLALAVDGANLYAGGYFTNVNNNGAVLGAADYIAHWNTSTNSWSALGSDGAGNGALGGLVNAIAVSGSNVYVGGSFSNVNNGGVVLTAADFVAKWNGSNWSALGSDGFGNGSLKSAVYALAVSGADVYVGGFFTNVNNNGAVLGAADYVAHWNTSTNSWSALGSNGAGNGALALNGYVMAILTNGADVYVGGSFTNVNNNGAVLGAADYLAKWDGSNWSALGDNGAGNGAILNQSTSSIMALAMQGGNLLAGGSFYDLNNGGAVLPQADYLAQWDGANWSALGAAVNGALVNGYSGSQVSAIAVIGTDVYVGGRFTDVSNHGLNIPEADYVAKWDGANWSALGGNGNGNGSLIGHVFALAVSGTDLYVGGQFTNVNNNGVSLPAADYVAKWDTVTENWSELGSNGAGNGALPGGSYVRTLAVNGADVYVGGGFTNVNNNGAVVPEADYLAKWDTLAGDWSALGSNGASDGSLNDSVVAIAPAGTSVYVGGTFTNVNNGGAVLNNADLIAEWDGTNWSALGSNGMGDGVFCVACGSSVSAIFVNGADVYIGGVFTNLNSNGTILNAADYIAKWDGLSWSALGSNGAGGGSIPTTVSTRVNAIAAAGSDLLVGGQFSNVNNNGAVLPEADYLAAFGMTGGGPDTTPPTVVSVTRLDPNPTGAVSVRFLVTFSEAIGGLDVSNFHVEAGGVTGAVITQMPCTGATCTITVSTGSGSGTIRLDVWDDDTIKDAANNPLGGAGVGNGDFTGGEVYDVQRYELYLPLIIK